MHSYQLPCTRQLVTVVTISSTEAVATQDKTTLASTGYDRYDIAHRFVYISLRCQGPAIVCDQSPVTA